MPSQRIRKDVAIVGGGPGGYVAAIRLAQLGKKVALLEKESLGGVCLNWGCIPSKALIHVAGLYEEIGKGAEFGLSAASVKLELAKTQEWKREVVRKLTGGIGQLLKAAGVQIVKGEDRFTAPHTVECAETAVEFSHAVVATGSRPLPLPGFPLDGVSVVDSKEALDWKRPPGRLLVVGGGVIGLEIGMLYRKLGSEVAFVELTSQLLPGMDADVAETMARVCRKRRMPLYLSSKARRYEKTKSGLRVEVETPAGPKVVECDVILLAVGRAPNGGGLGLEEIGVRVEGKGLLPVNGKLQTNLSHIYAIGDVTGEPLLAHKASRQAAAAAENIAGQPVELDVRAMPAAVFTDPEIAAVGLSEEEARAKGYDPVGAKFPFSALGRAVAAGKTEGFAKMVTDRATGLLLGCQVVGPAASELIGEAALAIEMGARTEDVALTVHPHPTLSESLMESAEAALGRAIHMLNREPAPEGRGHAKT